MSAKEVLKSDAADYLQPVPLPTTVLADAKEFVRRAQRSRTPLGAALEARTPMGFRSRAAQQLTDLGLDPDDADRVVEAVLLDPTVALRTDPDTGGREVLQACLVDLPDGAILRIVAQVGIANRKPPEVEELAVEAQVVDPDDDFAALMDELEGWYRTYPRPRGTDRGPRFRRSVLVMGNPLRLGWQDTPADWRELLAAAGAVWNVNVMFDSDGRSGTRGATVDVQVRLAHPPTGATAPLGGQGLPYGPGNTFHDLLDAFRRQCLDTTAAPAPATAEPRALQRGETVYHRKVGSGGGADRFDKGSSERLCKHTKTLKPYKKAPQAVKGMRRLYTNFEDDWLYHCTESGCGVYAVHVSGSAAHPGSATP